MTHDKVVHGVENVGVDYGVYRYYANDEKLLVIVGNKANAELIAEILNDDWHGKNHESKAETAENKGGWKPLTARPMTDEEITEYRNCAEYGEIFDCPLPDDGQEVLISVNGYTGVDTFVIDEGCYFEQADIFDVDAWQPLPEPYKAESEGKPNE